MKQHINIAFAGKRQHEHMGRVQTAVRQFLYQIYTQRSDIQANLMTGFADGADIRAAEALLDVKTLTSYTLTAVLPFPENDYRKTIQQDKEYFDKLLKLCDKIIVLDGRYLPDGAEAGIGLTPAICRARAYRQQSAFILHSCDILLAAADPDDVVKAGGTIETVNTALSAKIPVVLYAPATDNWYKLTHLRDLQALVARAKTLVPLSLAELVISISKNIMP